MISESKPTNKVNPPPECLRVRELISAFLKRTLCYLLRSPLRSRETLHSVFQAWEWHV